MGRNPLEIERLSRDLVGYLGFRGSGVETRALSAFDIALWDLYGKYSNQPLYQLLGGASREGCMVYGHANGSDIGETIERAHEYLEQGYKAVRLQAGVPGLKAAYGVSGERFYYEPAKGSLPEESLWSTEKYMRMVPELFARARDALGWDKVLNRAGTTFRRLPENEREGLDRDRAIALMVAQPSCIKRPLVEHDGGLPLGFKQAEWEAALG